MNSSILEIIRFIMVGGLGAAGYVGLGWFFSVSAGLEAFWASTLAYLVMIPPVYLAQKNITFASRSAHRSALVRYVVVQVGALMIAGAASYMFSQFMASPFEFVLANICSAAFSYVCMKLWAFRRQ